VKSSRPRQPRPARTTTDCQPISHCSHPSLPGSSSRAADPTSPRSIPNDLTQKIGEPRADSVGEPLSEFRYVQGHHCRSALENLPPRLEPRARGLQPQAGHDSVSGSIEGGAARSAAGIHTRMARRSPALDLKERARFGSVLPALPPARGVQPHFSAPRCDDCGVLSHGCEGGTPYTPTRMIRSQLLQVRRRDRRRGTPPRRPHELVDRLESYAAEQGLLGHQ
jgi:hypothetical protein